MAILLGACQPMQQEAPVYEYTIIAFGTLIDVSITGVDKASAEKAFETLEWDFNYMHGTWHAWRPSALSRINGLLPSKLDFSIAPSILPLITRADELAASSDNLFNPAIGKLIALWGFHNDEPTTHSPPDAEAIAALLAANPRMSDVHVKGIEIRGDNDAVQLDFGAFAKGFGVDVAIAHLRELGIENAIINAGGDLRAIGQRGTRPWRIGIRQPLGDGVLASLETQADESVFTSGDYERWFEYEGQRYHHILDPRTGYPAAGTRSVTVIHTEAALADAAATALFVAGPKDWWRIAKRMGLRYVLLVADDGTLHITPAMATRVDFGDNKPELMISAPL